MIKMCYLSLLTTNKWRQIFLRWYDRRIKDSFNTIRCQTLIVEPIVVLSQAITIFQSGYQGNCNVIISYHN